MSEDVIKNSEALDQLAKLILSNSKKNPSSLASIKEDYENKLKNLNELISMITSVELDKAKFSELVSKKIEIINKDGHDYVLIPVLKPQERAKTGKKKSKPNNIQCSYCKETGHLRSKCNKKLLGLPP